MIDWSNKNNIRPKHTTLMFSSLFDSLITSPWTHYSLHALEYTIDHPDTQKLLKIGFFHLKKLVFFIYRELLTLFCGENANIYDYKFYSENINSNIQSRKVNLLEQICCFPIQPKTFYSGCSSVVSHGQDSGWLVYRNFLVPVFVGLFVVVSGLESQGIQGDYL